MHDMPIPFYSPWADAEYHHKCWTWDLNGIHKREHSDTSSVIIYQDQVPQTRACQNAIQDHPRSNHLNKYISHLVWISGWWILASFLVNLDGTLVAINTNDFTNKFIMTNTDLWNKLAKKMYIRKRKLLPIHTWPNHACVRQRRLQSKSE